MEFFHSLCLSHRDSGMPSNDRPFLATDDILSGNIQERLLLVSPVDNLGLQSQRIITKICLDWSV